MSNPPTPTGSGSVFDELDALDPSVVEGGPVFDGVEEFVEHYLLVLYRRAVSGHESTWCPEWWRHPEALVRLEALWRSWEFLRLDAATGLSVWLRDHCDPHMRLLLSSDGPMKGCTPERHAPRPVRPLPHTAMPDELRRLLAERPAMSGAVLG